MIKTSKTNQIKTRRKIMENLNSSEFADEEEPSDYCYISGYAKPISVAEQVQILKDLFPCNFSLQCSNTIDSLVTTNQVPQGAEGYFAIPKWQLLGETYHEACRVVLYTLAKRQGEYYFSHDIKFDDEQSLRQSEYKVSSLQKIIEAQKGHDILIVSAQFGLLHKGRSVRRAIELMGSNEFGLGVLNVSFGCG